MSGGGTSKGVWEKEKKNKCSVKVSANQVAQRLAKPQE